MGSSSSRRRSRRHRSSRRKERRSTTTDDASSRRQQQQLQLQPQSSSPPVYSVEENSEGEWINSRLNVKWPQRVRRSDENKHRYLSYDDSSARTAADSSAQRQAERRARKAESKERRKKREEQKEASARAAVAAAAEQPAHASDSAESPYISLSIGSEKEEESDLSARIRRESKRMVVQTSPQRTSRRSKSGFTTDEDAKKIDSVVFDTRSEMIRYKKSDDIIVPGARATRKNRKKPSAADQRENEEYNRYFVGVKSRRRVEAKLRRPGEFALYYEKPQEGEVPLSVGLKIAYLSSTNEPYHFPIQCFEGADGHKHYVVMQNKSDGKMFTSILSLVKHYSLYSHVDTSTGRLETFSVPH